MRRTVSLLAAAAISTATVAVGGSSSASAVPRAKGAAAGVAQRWLSQQRPALRRSGMRLVPPQRAVGSKHAVYQTSYLEPAGHLTGGKSSVVLDERQTGQFGLDGKLGVTARDAKTGHDLWHIVLPQTQANNTIGVTPERFGPTGERGLLVLGQGQAPGTGTDIKVTEYVTALSGETGDLMWQQSLVGTIADDGSESAVPTPLQTFKVATSPSPDYFVALQTLTAATNFYTTQGYRISSANGMPAALGSSYNVAYPSPGGDDTFPVVQAVPDVNQDGTDDLLDLVPGSPSYARVEDGSNGGALWTTDMQLVDPGATPIGAFSLDGTSDIAIDSYPDGFTEHPITILQGSTGHTVLTRDAATILAIHRAGKKLHHAALFASFKNISTGSRYGTKATWVAVSPSNHTIYLRRHSMSVKPVANPSNSSAGEGYGDLGDVEPDGAEETRFDFDAHSSTATKSHDLEQFGFVDGATGAFIKTPDAGTTDGSLHKGAGTDLVAASVVNKHPQLTAYRAKTMKRYYRRTEPGFGGIAVARAYGARVSGHRCSDVLLEAAGAHKQQLGVLSATGVPLWSISFAPAALAGGTLAHGKPPRHYCE